MVFELQHSGTDNSFKYSNLVCLHTFENTFLAKNSIIMLNEMLHH